MSTKAKMAMEFAIWRQGKKKANLTTCINNLKKSDYADHLLVKSTIEFLTIKRKQLDTMETF